MFQRDLVSYASYGGAYNHRSQFSVPLLTPALKILTSRLFCWSRYNEGFLKVVPGFDYGQNGCMDTLAGSKHTTDVYRAGREARTAVFWVLMCVNCNVKLLISR